MRIEIDVLLDYNIPEQHDVLLQIEAAAMPDQKIITSSLTVTSPDPLRAVPGDDDIGQRTWANGVGQFRVEYSATVETERPLISFETLGEDAPRGMPAHVTPYLMPSRFCESDEFSSFVAREFGDLWGGKKVIAMRDWINRNVNYVIGSSIGSTTAGATFIRREGVCRDFAQLLATFARAANIPARLVGAYAPGVDPPDFHAVVEVWLDGDWHLLDATAMATQDEIVRIVVGRDATDIAFMTVFGSAMLFNQTVNVRRG